MHEGFALSYLGALAAALLPCFGQLRCGHRHLHRLWSLRNTSPSAQTPVAKDPARSPAARGGAMVRPKAPLAAVPKAAAPAKAIPNPTLAPSDLLDQPSVVTGTLQTVNSNGVLTYLPMDPGGRCQAQRNCYFPRYRHPSERCQGGGHSPQGRHGYLLPGFRPDLPLKKLEAFTLLPDGKAHTKQRPD